MPTSDPFPLDDYTPHGYLQNPYDAGPFYGLDAGGPIRSVEPAGFGWTSGGALRVGIRVGGDLFLLPEDFRSRGVELVSRYHTRSAQDFVWEWAGARVTLTFSLADRDVLACRVEVTGAPGPVEVVALASCPRTPKSWDGSRRYLEPEGAVCLYADPGPWYAMASNAETESLEAHGFLEGKLTHEGLAAAMAADRSAEGVSRASGVTLLHGALRWRPPKGGAVRLGLCLARGVTAREAAERAKEFARGKAAARLRRALREDSAFWSGAPRLTGDWPASWRRSWVYDLESTRMMIQPPAGIFSGPWPTWTAYHPRVVVAEGTLDMFRHGWADPKTAREAVLTLFTDAPADQVPCCWANGGYNMVAGDGNPCGTSPAWCLPFHNVYCLYLLDPDRDWLSRLYPPMGRYLNWWLRNRTDEEGWAVYKCTWESGEDCTPRLDPEQTGFRDLTRTARPGELQAAMAMSARVLALLGRELRRPAEEVAAWEAVYRRYRDLTHRLWDPKRGHFRDLLPATGRFVEARGDYWGATDVTHDALHLVPLLYDIATEEQRRFLVPHLAGFNALPWQIWPSWTYVATEACRAAGRHREAGRMAYDVLRRVYEENDRRDLTEHPRPLPGVTREYWPLSLEGYNAGELYGWGATTSLLLLRHLLGISESQETGILELRLAPCLPDDWLQTGRCYGTRNLHYRKARFDLELRPRGPASAAAGETGGLLDVRVAVSAPGELAVHDAAGNALTVRREGHAFAFQVSNGEGYRLRLG